MYRKGPHGSFTGRQLHKQHVFVQVVDDDMKDEGSLTNVDDEEQMDRK